MKYLFLKFKEVEEYYANHLGHIWDATVITEETGGRLRLLIFKWEETDNVSITIGEVKSFIGMDIINDRWRESQDWYKMETAIEPTGDEHLYWVENEEEDDEESEEEDDAEMDSA